MSRRTDVFGRFFYLVPTIPPHKVPVGEQELLLSEQVFGILWLIDLMKDSNGNCAQNTATALYERWWPHKETPPPEELAKHHDSSFSRIITKLVETRLVKHSVVRGDHRKHLLRLTDTGKKFLSELQETRIESVLSLLPPEEADRFFEKAEEIVDRTWKSVVDGLCSPAKKTMD